MANEPTQLSYQTTMPEYPDVSRDAWVNTWMSNPEDFAGSSVGYDILGFLSGAESYKSWRTNQLDKYNSAMTAYNTWLQSGAGRRASALSGNYNPSYFEGAGTPSASPISYGDTGSPSGFAEMAQGVSGIIQFATALQGIKMMSMQIAGQALKNEAQKINNKYLEGILSGKITGLGLKNDRSQFELEQLFYPRWSNRPELWKGGVFSPYGRETYDLRDADRGLGYQRAVADLDYLKAGKALRDSQDALMKATTREKQWYYDNVLEIQKEILSNTSKILAGEYDFQQTEQKLRKAGIVANISVGVINAAVNAIKAFTPSGVMSPSIPGAAHKTPLPDLQDIFGTLSF